MEVQKGWIRLRMDMASRLCCVVSLLLAQTHAVNTNSTTESPTQVENKNIAEKFMAWIVGGETWKIVLLSAGGLFLFALLCLGIFKIRKWHKSKCVKVAEEQTIEITNPQEDRTFMASHSAAGVVATTDVQGCIDQATKPTLKSKMMSTFTNEGKTNARYSFGMASMPRRSQREGCIDEETRANTPKSKGLFSKWRKEQKCQDEVIYQNQKDLLSNRENYSSENTKTCNADEPLYENSQVVMSQGVQNHSAFHNTQRIHQNSTIEAQGTTDYINASASTEMWSAQERAFPYQSQLSQSDDALDYMNVPQNVQDSWQKHSVHHSNTLQSHGRIHSANSNHDRLRNNAVRRSKSNVESFSMHPPPLPSRQNHRSTRNGNHSEWEALDWEHGMNLQTNTHNLMGVSQEWQRGGRHQIYSASTSHSVESFEDYDDIRTYRK